MGFAMNVKTLLLCVVLLAVAAFGWKHFNPDIGKIRANAGIDSEAVVMLWVPECGDICLDQAKQIRQRGVEVVNLDVNDGAAGQQLWKALRGGNGPYPAFLIGNEMVRANSAGAIRSKLIDVYGESTLTAREKKYFKKHFDAGVTPRAVLYTAEWCGYCKQLRSDLQSTNTPFTEIDVEKHNNPDELSEVMNIPGFPTVYFGYEKLKGDVSDIASQIRAKK
jgi:glutaredoxin